MTSTPTSDPSSISTTNDRCTRRSSMAAIVILFVLLIAATIVRILATQNDFWLDEILSLQSARAIASPGDVFTAIHTDNNHYLNTLYLYLLHDHSSETLFRAFSVACGILVIPAGYWLGAQRNRMTGLLLATFLTCSYPLIHFSSEARGYSGAILGVVTAAAAISAWLKRPSLLTAIIYGLAISFAILSHLTACLIWLPIALGSFLVLAFRTHRFRSLIHWLLLNLLPAATTLTLYLVDLRYLVARGGPVMTLTHGLSRLLGLSLGLPGTDALSTAAIAVLSLAIIGSGLLALRRKRDPLSLPLFLIFITPLLLLFLIQPAFFSPRYFLVFVPFLYFAIASAMAQWTTTKGGRIIAPLVLTLFVAGQGFLYYNFLKVGRGQFTAGLAFISNRTPSPFLNIASSQDFRGMTELQYFGPSLSPKRPLYLQQNDQGFIAPDWYILHSEGFDLEGPETLVLPEQPPWYRAAYFPASELSGQAWTLYSHQPPVTSSSALPPLPRR